MKFIILKSHYMSKDRVVLKENCYPYNATATLGYLLTIRTFNENDDILVLEENTDSVQIRPKAIYKNNQGYYILKDSKRVYLDNVEEIENAIKELKEMI